MGMMDWFTRKTPAPAPARRRGFQGAMYNRLVADWITASTSMDAEIRKDLKRLRDRSRDLVRNNDYARGFLVDVESNVIGATPFDLRMDAHEVQAGGKKKPDVSSSFSNCS